MGKVRPHLWFDHEAEEAATFYAATIPGSRITHVNRAPEGVPGVEAGAAFVVELELDGMPVTFLNGGPGHPQTDAFSLVVDCADQAEVDHYWAALTADGGTEGQCGWCQDRFGVWWQVVPRGMEEVLAGDDPEGTRRAMGAMFGMRKLDVAALWAAYRGETATV
ncbi:VOC family protein [Cellulomonas marina]|uniref:Glyoxalase superfamily enzyme, possibly 3-demethylubiquinone-9 3-methyltransferase n=1 Tax=Cellulomonas marina TaxID=988821 RepID=A0A1I1A1G3_9CELL|nr:VOC family protein [Cellulomonas marina]GIG30497.1 VOC family protein [Cellulomonas marina]SFB31785.1 Glyoxalase superfamily enzyme, possibly 3-demethylubiquinone-9 3-methyltransferase [Cellulomonas marina]